MKLGGILLNKRVFAAVVPLGSHMTTNDEPLYTMSNLPSPFMSAIAVGPLSLAAIKLAPTIVLRSFKMVVTPVAKLTP